MKLLRSYMKIHEITQKRMAEKIGCTPTCINNLVMGKHTDIKISLLSRICSVTNISMERMVDDLLSAREGIQSFGPNRRSKPPEATVNG